METKPECEPVEKLGSLSLLPFLGFLLLYVGAGLWFVYLGQDMAFYQFPAPSCALFGFGVALCLGHKNVRGHIKTFASGIGDETVVLMCIIFLLAGAFSALTQATGAVDATVNLGIFLLPDRLLLPGIFLIACFISFSMGTSMGTISTITPIALGLSQTVELSLPLVAASVLGGAMFGDNLSLISDTTIAATGTQGCTMKEKMAANMKIAMAAALVVMVILFFLGKPGALNPGGSISLVRVMPYALVLALALWGAHVIVVLMIGILSSVIIGITTSSFAVFDVGQIVYSGFESMSDVFYVTILIAGLAAIAAREGGIDFLLTKILPLARGKKSAEMVIAVCVSAADICVANNTIAILFAGPVAKKIADKFKLARARTASILDTYSCIWQGIIPHGAQVLLVGGLCKISGFALLPYSFYPLALAISASVNIFLGEKIVSDK